MEYKKLKIVIDKVFGYELCPDYHCYNPVCEGWHLDKYFKDVGGEVYSLQCRDYRFFDRLLLINNILDFTKINIDSLYFPGTCDTCDWDAQTYKKVIFIEPINKYTRVKSKYLVDFNLSRKQLNDLKIGRNALNTIDYYLFEDISVLAKVLTRKQLKTLVKEKALS